MGGGETTVFFSNTHICKIYFQSSLKLVLIFSGKQSYLTSVSPLFSSPRLKDLERDSLTEKVIPP